MSGNDNHEVMPITLEAIGKTLNAILEQMNTTTNTANAAFKMAKENSTTAQAQPIDVEWEDQVDNQEVAKPDEPPLTDLEKKLINKVEALEKSVRSLHRSEELVDVRSLSLFPQARMPAQFKTIDIEKFKGTGDPKIHLKMYTRVMHLQGATDDLLTQMFQMSLAGPALYWFLRLDESKVRTWDDVCSEFMKHYRYNTEVDITRRDLETTKQGSNETFSSFITRWRLKASQMVNRPSEEEQIQMLVRNLLPIYHKHLFAHYFPNFKALIGAGTQIEDAIANGTVRSEDQQRTPKRHDYNNKPAEIDNITTQQHVQRHFDELYMPLGQAFEKLKTKGLISPMEPTPLPNPLPRWFNDTEFCDYHQNKGHRTDRCRMLKHEIQNLIDLGMITTPKNKSSLNMIAFTSSTPRSPYNTDSSIPEYWSSTKGASVVRSMKFESI